MAPTPLDRSRDADAQREAQRANPSNPTPADGGQGFTGVGGKVAHDRQQHAERVRRITNPRPDDGGAA